MILTNSITYPHIIQKNKSLQKKISGLAPLKNDCFVKQAPVSFKGMNREELELRVARILADGIRTRSIPRSSENMNDNEAIEYLKGQGFEDPKYYSKKFYQRIKNNPNLLEGGFLSFVEIWKTIDDSHVKFGHLSTKNGAYSAYADVLYSIHGIGAFMEEGTINKNNQDPKYSAIFGNYLKHEQEYSYRDMMIECLKFADKKELKDFKDDFKNKFKEYAPFYNDFKRPFDIVNFVLEYEEPKAAKDEPKKAKYNEEELKIISILENNKSENIKTLLQNKDAERFFDNYKDIVQIYVLGAGNTEEKEKNIEKSLNFIKNFNIANQGVIKTRFNKLSSAFNSLRTQEDVKNLILFLDNAQIRTMAEYEEFCANIPSSKKKKTSEYIEELGILFEKFETKENKKLLEDFGMPKYKTCQKYKELFEKSEDFSRIFKIVERLDLKSEKRMMAYREFYKDFENDEERLEFMENNKVDFQNFYLFFGDYQKSVSNLSFKDYIEKRVAVSDKIGIDAQYKYGIIENYVNAFGAIIARGELKDGRGNSVLNLQEAMADFTNKFLKTDIEGVFYEQRKDKDLSPYDELLKNFKGCKTQEDAEQFLKFIHKREVPSRKEFNESLKELCPKDKNYKNFVNSFLMSELSLKDYVNIVNSLNCGIEKFGKKFTFGDYSFTSNVAITNENVMKLPKNLFSNDEIDEGKICKVISLVNGRRSFTESLAQSLTKNKIIVNNSKSAKYNTNSSDVTGEIYAQEDFGKSPYSKKFVELVSDNRDFMLDLINYNFLGSQMVDYWNIPPVSLHVAMRFMDRVLIKDDTIFNDDFKKEAINKFEDFIRALYLDTPKEVEISEQDNVKRLKVVFDFNNEEYMAILGDNGALITTHAND